MEFISSHKLLSVAIVVVAGLVLLALSQFLFIKFNGTYIPAPEIPRQTQTFGQGEPLSLVVIGDSTAIGQGAEYGDSIATKSAEYLARNHTVKLTNFGISGAIAKDVLDTQAKPATALKPNVVLLAVGANDVTKLSSISAAAENVRQIVGIFRASNPAVKIIMTGSPAVGTVPRFGKPTQWLAAYRVNKINEAFDIIVREENVVRLRIAERTGPIFAGNPDLFAEDNFHPNAAGYKVWMPIIYEAL